MYTNEHPRVMRFFIFTEAYVRVAPRSRLDCGVLLSHPIMFHKSLVKW